ncbi:MAG: DUF3145 domain-containing protein [Propionicimonas sp.]|uniref:DUF3145 domain-containing protein n=1 Tax=Propionicimonas sp. TaxID=1955623 RepID=UPI002B1ECE0A|nr:DUF3145 domain-containing protein [Propionicimonas sp.]MEA4944625.1 DUF3145 domain-containing protein [Propionicimonas sp.]MEA5117899.1 DUF3145 domain-containing protein [Propionicimonas sp.]
MDITRGVILIHSAPAALCPHLEWAVSAATGSVIRFDWTPQPAEPRTMRAEHLWSGDVGSGAAIASALAGCQRARFEVTEDATRTTEGQRWAYTPRLGVFSAATGPTGDIMVHENRLKRAITAEALGGKPLAEALQELLGTRWDDELEVFRHACEGTPVRWLHAVG